MKGDEVLLLENLRFYNEEKKGDEKFAEDLVKPADVYVSDAFSTAHRAHASMVAAVKLRPSAMGLLMEEEVNALTTGLNDPKRPLMAIVGGSKVSTKLDLLNNLVKKVDMLVISGGMAHTFMKASGIDTVNEANSLVQMDMIETAKEIMKTAKANNSKPMPSTKPLIWNIFRLKAGALWMSATKPLKPSTRKWKNAKRWFGMARSVFLSWFRLTMPPIKLLSVQRF